MAYGSFDFAFGGKQEDRCAGSFRKKLVREDSLKRKKLYMYVHTKAKNLQQGVKTHEGRVLGRLE